MKEKIYGTGILLGLAVLLFCGSSTQEYDTKATFRRNMSYKREVATKNFATAISEIIALETETLEAKILKAEETKEKEDEMETSENKEDINQQQKEYEGASISFNSEQNEGNIVGYTLWRSGGGSKWYSRDPDYLIPQELVGKGVYVSEHLWETEVFVGKKLAGLLTDRGKIGEEDRQYYMDWAIQQMEAVDWSLLDEGWEPDPFTYDRHYSLVSLSGIGQYLFGYSFYPGQKVSAGSKTQVVSISLLVDKGGVFSGIDIDIRETSSELASQEELVNITGLYNDIYSEAIIWDGRVEEGKIMMDFSRYYQSFDLEYEPQEDADASIRAGELAAMCMDMLESRGEHAEGYRDYFESSLVNDYAAFLNLPWEQMDENWRADEKFDCEYFDYTYRSGGIKFRYYFFPDYEKMGKDKAKAAIVDCFFYRSDSMDKSIDLIDLHVFELSREEYESNQSRGKVQVIDAGKISETAGSILLPIPRTTAPNVPLREYTFDSKEDAGVEYVEGEIWGDSNVAELAAYFGEKLRADIKQADIKIENGQEYSDDLRYIVSGDVRDFLERAGESWEAGSDYDCFYIKENERAGCIQLRYYFYPRESESEREWVLVLDAFVSEDGIEDMAVNSYVRKAGCRLY